ncbi:MAG: DUF1573 domain-containing protein [Bacteroides sp.]|nr:DUF1573 domain-containing protein [Bacteroides sp.]MBD5347606.1 DUF1573 domain-containing protein [Bacteroides sp.]
MRQFTLFNKGDEPVTIQELVASCYCILYELSKL